MAKKNRSRKIVDPGNAAGFEVNPFAELRASDLGLAKQGKEAQSKDAEAPANGSAETAPLSEDDRRLIEELGHAQLAFSPSPSVEGTVSLQVQRKGRGGKTVTRVHGLSELSLPAEMELINRLKKELGTGAHFREGVVELQGDLRQRASEWFARHNYRVKA